MLEEEPVAPRLRLAIHNDPVRLISAVSVLELTCVLTARRGAGVLPDLSLFLREFNFEVVPFDSVQLEFAQAAWLRFGRGFHPARLNFGDCASYALAASTREPLLFVGGDFAQTDIPAALTP
jgi:ribonuclease VapC